MEKSEMATLALVALGALSVDTRGRIWRHREVTHGSAAGGREVVIPSRRADTGRSKGYLRVQVTVDGERMQAYAHRIAWMVTNQRAIPAGLEVNHRDGDRTNNAPPNLELVTKAHNVAHGLHALGAMQRRKTSGAKLSPTQVVEIRALCQTKSMSKVAIAAHFGVTTKTVRNIETRAKWADLVG